jgi:uncharacterized protein YggU (UPF0235/DUF167 family)
VNIEVKVIAGAKRREIRLEGSLLKVKVVAKPIHGQANDELINYLAAILELKRRDVRIVAGERGTRKIVSVPVDEKRVREAIDRGEIEAPF